MLIPESQDGGQWGEFEIRLVSLPYGRYAAAEPPSRASRVARKIQKKPNKSIT